MTTYGKATIWVILASATVTVMGGAIIAPVLNLMTGGLGVDPGAPIILSPLESSLGLNTVFLIIGAACALVLVSFLVLVRQQGTPEARGKQ